MLIITLQRKKCIGCRLCVEYSPENWTMSRKDGKSILINSKEKNGFFTLKTVDNNYIENKKAADECPVNIIKVKKL